MHVPLLSFPTQLSRRLIQNRLTLIGFLFINCSRCEIKEEYGERGSDKLFAFGLSCSELVLLLDSVWLMSRCMARKKWSIMLQKSRIPLTRSSLSKRKEERFNELNNSAKPRKCFPSSVTYCCYILNEKGICTVLHRSTVFRPCARSSFTIFKVCYLQHLESRNLEHTKTVRACTTKKVKKAKTQSYKVIIVTTKGSRSAASKLSDVSRGSDGSLFVSSVIWFHTVRARTRYSHLKCCVICALEFQRWWKSTLFHTSPQAAKKPSQTSWGHKIGPKNVCESLFYVHKTRYL